MSFWVYILASKPFGTLYVGVTNDVIRRAHEHREGVFEGFTKQYGVKMLVYYEERATALEAIQREKNIKHWPRARKVDLVRKMKPEWRDLFDEIAQPQELGLPDQPLRDCPAMTAGGDKRPAKSCGAAIS